MFLSIFFARTLPLAVLIFFACTAFRTWSASAMENDNFTLVSCLLLVECVWAFDYLDRRLPFSFFFPFEDAWCGEATFLMLLLFPSSYIIYMGTIQWCEWICFDFFHRFLVRKWFRFRIDSLIHRYSMRVDFRFSEVMKNSCFTFYFRFLGCVLYCILYTIWFGSSNT